jgi:signal transduction histidine kinase
MKMKRESGGWKQLTVLIGMIGVFAVVTSLFIFEWLNPAHQYPEAQSGVLDAEHWDFAQLGTIPLRGEWEFYENKLLTPQDFQNDASALQSERRFIRVPGGIDTGSGYGAGTYRLQVKVGNPDFYSLRGKKMRLSSRVFMGGADLGGSGVPALTAERFVPSNLPFFGTIKAESDTIDIVIQIASFRYMPGGLVQAPEFGLTEDVMARRDHARLADVIVITSLLVFGFYFAGMYKQWRREPYLMFFSLFCFSLGLFFSIDNEIVLAAVFPAISFPLLQKSLFILTFISIYAFTFYVYMYLDHQAGRGFQWLHWISFGYLAFMVAMPNAYLMKILWLGIVLQIIVFAYIFSWVFLHRTRGVHVYYILLGIFFLIVTWIYGQMRYLLALDNPYYMIVTPLLFVLSQSFLMAERSRSAFLQSERLTEQLMMHDRQKDEFLIRTSHEFKTPLHGIINLAQVVIDQSGHELAQRQRENLDFIIAQATRLSALVNDIIDFQSLQRGSLTFHNRRFDVSGTVQATLESLKYLRRNEQVRLVNLVRPGTAYLYADENRLKQILVNLIGNALKYTEHGSITASAESRGGWLCLKIADTGTGISPERQRELFTDELQAANVGDESASSLYRSSGLGLNISKALAVQMGGDLVLLRSEPGRGSVFELRLPEAAEAREEAESGPAEAEAAAAGPELPLENVPAALEAKEPECSDGIKILIVDDDVSNIKVLEELFAPSGYRVLKAYNGADALRLIERHRGELSLVLLDVMMPGLSGYEVCRRIRDEYPLYKLPVLLLTVRHSTADIAMGFEAGANDFLVKPFSGREMLARVRTLLQMKEAAEQAIRMESLFLQSQIKPHFIYNALNSIISLCYIDGARAGQLLGELSNYLRLVFDLDPRYAKVSLKRELSLTKSYVELEKARFGARLNVEWDVNVSAEILIPALILQPLVENAIRHGLMKRLSGGTLIIRAKQEPLGLRIAVQDDGVGMSSEQSARILTTERMGGSIGLINVHRRLMHEFGEGLRVESVRNEGTTVSFLIPAHAQRPAPDSEAED